MTAPVALLVGDVAELVETELDQMGFDVTRLPMDAPVALPDDLRLLVIHEEDEPGDDPRSKFVDVWLEHADATAGVTLGYSTPRYSKRRWLRRVMRYATSLVVETEATPDQVRAQLGRIEPTSGVGPEGFRIGSLFTSDADTYEERRFTSMWSRDNTDLAVDLMFAAKMHNPGRRLPRPPWDPIDGGHSLLDRDGRRLITGRAGAQPNLLDVYAAARTDAKARDLLQRFRPGEIFRRPPLILVQGESGSGKSLVADALWQFFADQTYATGKPRDMPFIKVNCGGMSAEAFDNTMIGWHAEEFSATGTTVGLFGRADYGVLFLDEIGHMTDEAQSRLKTVLDDLVITPKGLQPYPLHLWVIAATNVDLLGGGRPFQHDLLRRFTTRITVPALNSRPESDRRRIIDFVAQDPAINPVADGHPLVTHIAPEAMDLLVHHDYTEGNFRELQQMLSEGIGNAVKRRGSVLRREHLNAPPKRHPDDDLVIDVDRLPNVDRPSIVVTSSAELRRAARLADRPIFRDASGLEYLITPEVILTPPHPRPDGSSNATT